VRGCSRTAAARSRTRGLDVHARAALPRDGRVQLKSFPHDPGREELWDTFAFVDGEALSESAVAAGRPNGVSGLDSRVRARLIDTRAEGGWSNVAEEEVEIARGATATVHVP